MPRFFLLSIVLIVVTITAACGSSPAVVSPTQLSAVISTTTPAQSTLVTATTTAAPAITSVAVATTTATPKPMVSTLTIKLRKGLKWSDGSDLTAKDFVGTYDILWATGDSVGGWAYLKDVIAKDDTTLEFQITTPSPRALRLFLRSNHAALYSQYGRWMDQAHELRIKGADPKSDEVKKLVDSLNAFKPPDAVVYGPFKLDLASVTEAQLWLVKNHTGFNADKIGFEKLIVYYGETTASVPLVLSGELDYSSNAYTPTDLESFEKLPQIKIIHGPTGIGPGLWFNESVYPLDKKEVRQAFAYVIDRAQNATVALGESGRPIKYMAGFSDLLVPQWLSQNTIAKLNPYTMDLKKAEELLTSIGFKKGSDGIWVDDKDRPLAFEISVPSDYIDWLSAAENASQQLNAFGIKTTVRGYQSSERSTMIREAKYQILVDVCMSTTLPHLSWYMWADGKYVPVVAESYELKDVK